MLCCDGDGRADAGKSVVTSTCQAKKQTTDRTQSETRGLQQLRRPVCRAPRNTGVRNTSFGYLESICCTTTHSQSSSVSTVANEARLQGKVEQGTSVWHGSAFLVRQSKCPENRGSAPFCRL